MILEYRIIESSETNPEQQLKELRKAMANFNKFYCLIPSARCTVEGSWLHVNIKPSYSDMPIKNLSAWNPDLPKEVKGLEKVDFENGYVDLKIGDCLYTVFFKKPDEKSEDRTNG